MGNYLDKDGLTRFKEKMLTEVDKRIATGGGGSTSGDSPTKEELIEATSRVTDVEVNPEVATLERLQTGLASVESNLGNKLSITTTHLVESWRSGKNWYRKYSDGWIEQGGIISTPSSANNMTISLNTPFTSTDYVAVKNYCLNASGSGSITARSASIWSQTTTSFVTYVHNYPETTVAFQSWYACGY